MNIILVLIIVFTTVLTYFSIPINSFSTEFKYFCKQEFFDGFYYNGKAYILTKRINDTSYERWVAFYKPENEQEFEIRYNTTNDRFLRQSGFHIEKVSVCDPDFDNECNRKKKLESVTVELSYQMKDEYSAYTLTTLNGTLLADDRLPYGLQNSSQLLPNDFWPRDSDFFNKQMYKPSAFRQTDYKIFYIYQNQNSKSIFATNSLANKNWIKTWNIKTLEGYEGLVFTAMFWWFKSSSIYAVLDSGIHQNDTTMKRIGFVYELKEVDPNQPFININKRIRDLFGCEKLLNTGAAGSGSEKVPNNGNKGKDPKDNEVLIIVIVIVVFVAIILCSILFAIYFHFHQKRKHTSKESIASLSDINRLKDVRNEYPGQTANTSQISVSNDKPTSQYSRSTSKYSKKSPISGKSHKSKSTKSHKH